MASKPQVVPGTCRCGTKIRIPIALIDKHKFCDECIKQGLHRIPDPLPVPAKEIPNTTSKTTVVEVEDN